MKILAIETSCDDTAVAILQVSDTYNFKVLANIIASQVEIGKKYGGVYPIMAKREHERNLLPTLIKALAESKLLKISNFQFSISNKFSIDQLQKPDIDLIAVTNGPGLEPCLWVGVNFAKDLAKKWDISIVPVNHIESHILVNFLAYSPVIARSEATKQSRVKFPAVCLVVSGGHTQLILMKKIGSYKILGETRDDAAGECFDKCAKILGLDYPGGPIIAKLTQKADRNPTSIQLPRPMINTKDYDFSFSGLKTAVLYAWQKLQKENSKFFASRPKTYQLQTAFAKEIQQAIIDVLIKKTMKAVKDYGAKTIILGGGVSANKELRKQFGEELKKVSFLPGGQKLTFMAPKQELSTDNAVMTAIAGYFNRNKKVAPSKVATIKANSNLRISD